MSWPNINYMLDTNIDQTLRHVHACMSKGFMPVAMHEKGRRKDKEVLYNCRSNRNWNSTCTSVLHNKTNSGARWWISAASFMLVKHMAWSASIFPFCLDSLLRIDKYPFSSLYLVRRSHMLFYILCIRIRRNLPSYLQQLKLLITPKTPPSKVILTPEYYWHLQLRWLIRQVSYFTKQ